MIVYIKWKNENIEKPNEDITSITIDLNEKKITYQTNKSIYVKPIEIKEAEKISIYNDNYFDKLTNW